MTSANANSDNELQQDSPVPVQRPSDAPAYGARAVFYRRAPSPGRVETDDSSIAAQREACLRKARELGFLPIDVYVDPDARLRGRPKRQVFRRMLAWFRGH